jgi:hypothetical protein
MLKSWNPLEVWTHTAEAAAPFMRGNRKLKVMMTAFMRQTQNLLAKAEAR